jgi:hypothetical protein
MVDDSMDSLERWFVVPQGHHRGRRFELKGIAIWRGSRVVWRVAEGRMEVRGASKRFVGTRRWRFWMQERLVFGRFVEVPICEGHIQK